MKLIILYHLMLRLRVSGVIPPYLHMLLCCTQERVYLYFILDHTENVLNENVNLEAACTL